MATQNIAIMLILAVGAVLAAYISFYAWKHRTIPGSIYFILMMLGVALWSVANAAEHGSLTIPSKIVFAKISYLGIVSLPVLWFNFALSYSQNTGWLRGKRRLLLWIMPLITLSLVSTNELHHLIWSDIVPGEGLPGTAPIYKFGFAFWIHAAYSYVFLLSGAVILIRKALRSPNLFKRQAGTMIAATLIPWAANVLVLTNINPFPGIDLTPISFTLTGLLIYTAVFRFQILDIIPIAREALIENLGDGILVFDALNRVVDVNPKACEILQTNPSSIVGRIAQQAMEKWPDLFQKLQAQPEQRVETCTDAAGWLEWQLTPFSSKNNRSTGSMIVIRDINSSKMGDLTLQEYTHELESRNAELDAFALAVARDLRKPLYDVIQAGLELQAEADYSANRKVKLLTTGVLRSSRQMSNIITSLNLLSDLRKRKTVDIAPLNMHRIYGNVIKRLADLLYESQAEMVHPEDWPIVKGYEPWVEEVLYNYISNAIHYGGHPPRVSIGFEACPPNNGSGPVKQVRFWVLDNGRGMTPEKTEQLFVDFRNLGQVRVEGQGLGLVVVRGIVEKLGGQVGIKSNPGSGSLFYFTLPQIESVL